LMRWLRLMGWMRWVRGGSDWGLVDCAWLGRERGKKRGFNHEKTRKNAKKEKTRKEFEQKEAKGAKKRFLDRINRMNRMGGKKRILAP